MNNMRQNVTKLLATADNSPMKIYLDGFDVLDFLRLTQIIQSYGGKVSIPADDTLVLSTRHHPPGTTFIRFDISWLYDSIKNNKRQDIGKYLLPAVTSENHDEQINNENSFRVPIVTMDSKFREIKKQKEDHSEEISSGNQFQDADITDDLEVQGAKSDKKYHFEETSNDNRFREADITDRSKVHENEFQEEDLVKDSHLVSFDVGNDEPAEDQNTDNGSLSDCPTNSIHDESENSRKVDDESDSSDISKDDMYTEPEQVQNAEEPRVEEGHNSTEEANLNVVNAADSPETNTDHCETQMNLSEIQVAIIGVKTVEENESLTLSVLFNSSIDDRLIELFPSAKQYGNAINQPLQIKTELCERNLTDDSSEKICNEMDDGPRESGKPTQNDEEIQSFSDEEKSNLNNPDSSVNGCWRFADNTSEDGNISCVGWDNRSWTGEDLIAPESNIDQVPIPSKDVQKEIIAMKRKTRGKRIHPMMTSSKRPRKRLKADAGPRIRYSAEEDRKIIQYLIDKEAIFRTDGISIWDEMVSEGILPNRSAASLKFRFTTNLKHNFNNYTDDPIALKKFEQLITDTRKSMRFSSR